MSPFDDVLEALKGVLDDLPQKRLDFAEVSARDAIAIVSNRIIETGVDANGNDLRSPSGTVYSEAVVPYWFYANKPSNRDARVQAEQMRDNVGYFASYTDWRQQHDLPVDHVTLSFTGEMWKSMDAKLEQHDQFTTTYDIGPSDEENQKKIGYLSALYNVPILALQESEANLIIEGNNMRIEDCFRDRGFDLS